MKKMGSFRKQILATAFLSLWASQAFGQNCRADYVVTSDNKVLVKTVYNNEDQKTVIVSIDGTKKEIAPGSSWPCNMICDKTVNADIKGEGGRTILNASNILAKEGKKAEEATRPSAEPVSEQKAEAKAESNSNTSSARSAAPQGNTTASTTATNSDGSHEAVVDDAAWAELADTMRVARAATDGNAETDSFSSKMLSDPLLRNIAISVVALILLIIGFVVIARRKRDAARPTVIPGESSSGSNQSNPSGVEVRGKTTAILKPQSLDDVKDNPAYMPIECSDFCDDSAVRRIYIKNTCVKDIYNMYADDLRNPDNPNEDGCMVLGRWVLDKASGEYCVSLEEIVKPGDDAVFKEYELNFGGKIKMKVSTRLRKLRAESNLQYDMTCWVHSHPGLGVFFSNADSGVHSQLKHPTHPKFLTAIVIDILTPNQELGIFTFKHDMTINSKPELKRMYSLEEMYQWAVESDRCSFKREDHYNLMTSAKHNMAACHGCWLSNGAIIDMCQMVDDRPTGIAGWAYGYDSSDGDVTEWAVKGVSTTRPEAGRQSVKDGEVLAPFIVGTHRSIPTIRKAIGEATGLHFVLFYSTTDGVLTAIPVVDGQLVADENNFGEETLEELKIWTRRKR